MKLNPITLENPLKTDADVLIIPVGSKKDRMHFFESVEGIDNDLLDTIGFEKAKEGETATTVVDGKLIIFTGLGDAGETKEERRANGSTLMKAAGSAIRKVPSGKSVALVANSCPGSTFALSVGAALGSYKFTEYKKPEDGAVQEITVITEKPEMVKKAQAYAEATSLSRDLVNLAPADKRPEDLAERIEGLMEDKDVALKVFDKAWMEENQAAGLLGVGRGSEQEPRMIEIDYNPEGAEGHVMLVGKGITFDTGGINIKPGSSMADMKMDMAGTAVVVGVMSALSELGVKVRVTGYCTIAENMPSGTAQRPSDVLRMMNGKTVEIGNTDAEGRLVMADGLVYGSRQKPDVIIDMATLTGAQIVVSGNEIACVMGTGEEYMNAFVEESKKQGEEYIILPLPESYKKGMKSSVADMNNISGAKFGAGTIMAGMFLKEFVEEDVPWFHIDFAGPAYTDKPSGYLTDGGTGFSVRGLLAWLEKGIKN